MKLRRNRHQKGSVVLDRRSKVWDFRYNDKVTGKRKAERIGTFKEFPTKTKAQEAAQPIRLRVFGPASSAVSTVTVKDVAIRYEKERMPQRHSTSRGYKGKIKIVLAKWGKHAMPLKPYKVEAWLKTVKTKKGRLYSKKTREHLKAMLYTLHDAATFFEYLSDELRNPMELVRVQTVNGAPKPKPRIVLTQDEFRRLLAQFAVGSAHRVMVLLAACVGLRCSEIFALRWSDINWLKSEIFVQGAVVEGYVDDCKTESSNAVVPLHPEIAAALLAWRQTSPYNEDGDWVFASPVKLGKMPLWGGQIQTDVISPAAVRVGLPPLGWHAFRHSYRSWLGALGTGREVQKNLMRHSTIAMSLDGYGRGIPEANREANSQLVSELLQ
jgi:integrase